MVAVERRRIARGASAVAGGRALWLLSGGGPETGRPVLWLRPGGWGRSQREDRAAALGTSAASWWLSKVCGPRTLGIRSFPKRFDDGGWDP